MSNYPRASNWQYRAVPEQGWRAIPPLAVALAFAIVGVVTALIFFQAAPEILAAQPLPAQTPAATVMAKIAPAAQAPERPSTSGAPGRDEDPSLERFAGQAKVTMDLSHKPAMERAPVQLIRTAKRSVKLQSYRVNSPDLQEAIRTALANGAVVEIMVDQPMYLDSKGYFDALKRAGARILINSRSGADHDKTIIVDATHVLLGSINFSQHRSDAEFRNTLSIESPDVSALYLKHWNEHAAASTTK